MTVGYDPIDWTESDSGGDREYHVNYYGLKITSNTNDNIGSIVPQNIGTFKITHILNIEHIDYLIDGTDKHVTHNMYIRATLKCLISFKGRTYRVDTPRDNYYEYDSSADSIYFNDGEKVEITYELL